MKAKEYYEKFGEAVLNEAIADDGSNEHTSMLVIAFLRETKEIIAARHVRKDKGAIAVIKEQNEKWNSLCALFEKNLGASPIARNGFMAYMKMEIPELAKVVMKQ